MKWFKFYGQDFLTDSKLGALNPLQRLMWVGLLCIASQDDERTGIIRFLTEDRLMDLCGIRPEDFGFFGGNPYVTIETFCNMKLVTCNKDDDTITVTNFKMKQTKQSTSAERVREWRAKNKDKIKKIKPENNVTDVTNVTLQSNGRIDKNRIENINTFVPSETLATEQKNFSQEDIGHFRDAWNKYEKYQGSCKNQWAKQKLLPKCRGVTPEIEKAFSKLKGSTAEDVSTAMKNYLTDIINRNPANDYAKHRFSFYEFFKQENGFKKFLNK